MQCLSTRGEERQQADHILVLKVEISFKSKLKLKEESRDRKRFPTIGLLHNAFYER
jgi:hypothetical protein